MSKPAEPSRRGESKTRATPIPSRASAPARREWSDSIVLGSFLLPILMLFGAFLFSNAILYGSDTIPMGYMARQLYRTMWTRFQEFPLWNPYILGGLPFVDALHGDIFYPTTIIKFLLPLHRGIGLVLVFHVFLAGVFMFLCLRGEGLSKIAAWFGGLAYMAGPYLNSLILAGHDGKIYVTTLFPLAYFLLRRAERSGRLPAYAGFGACVGLMILTAHIQMAYFALWALGIQFLTHLYGLRREPARLARAAGLFVFAIALGLGIGAVQLYPSYVYTSQFGPRSGGLSYATATSWSLHPEEIVSLWFPEFVSYQHQAWDGYWGRNPFKLNCESPGAIPVLLALAFLFFAREPGRRYLGFLVAGALVYALGANTPLFRIFYALLPGVKLFRAPSIIAFLIHFAVVVLAARAVDRWIVRRAGESQEARRVLVLLAALAAFLLLVLALGDGFLGIWRPLDPALTQAKARAFAANVENLRVGALLGLGAIGLVAWLVWRSTPRASGRGKDRGAERASARAGVTGAPGALGVTGAVLVLGAATFLMDWRIDRDFIRAEPLERYIRSDKVIEFLRAQNDGGPFRVLSATERYPANYLPIFEIESPQGFHDNRIRTFDELIMKDQTVLGHPGIADLLNVRYFVSERPFAGYREAFRDGAMLVLENASALPRATLHRRAEVATDAQTLARMRAPGWDPRSGLLLDRDPGLALDPAADPSSDRVEMTRYTPNRISLRVTAGAPALLLVTNNYLPYWRATIDGAEAPVLRADYTFQAIPVPAGTHEVSLAFRSAPFEKSLVVSGIALLVAAAAIASGAWPRRKGNDADRAA